MGDPSIFVLTLGVIQLAREVVALFRNRSRAIEILVLIAHDKEAR